MGGESVRTKSDKNSLKKSRKRHKSRSSRSHSYSRSPPRSKSPSPQRKRRRSRSNSSSPSQSSSGSSDEESSSSSEDSEEERRRRKKRKKEKRRKEKEKKEREKKRKRKQKKKEKKEKKKRRKMGSLNTGYGKYGIVQRNELHAKQEEFQAWLIDIKKLARDTISHREEREYFEEFVEDYNTCTFPSKKYYDLTKWAAKQAAKNLRNAPKQQFTGTDEENKKLEARLRKAERDKHLEQIRVSQIASHLRKDSQQLKSKLKERHASQAPSTFASLAEERRKKKMISEGRTMFD